MSIPSNIAEGNAIRGKSYLRHLRIALGSEAELQTQIELTVRLGLMTAKDAEPVLASASEVGRMIRGLIRSLNTKTEQPGSPGS